MSSIVSGDEILLLTLIDGSDVQEAPHSIQLARGHKIITIGIGNDHVAEIIIDSEDLEVLKRRVFNA